MQGAVHLDTGTFTGLREAYRDLTKGQKEFTPEQAKVAVKMAERSKTAETKRASAQDELFEDLKKQEPTQDERQRAVWKKVREVIAAGDSDYRTVLNKVATELGMKFEDVAKEVGRNQKTKKLADEVWKNQLTARRMKEQAKRWLASLTVPNWQKVPRAIWDSEFTLKVGAGLHGFVPLGTHAPMVLYDPHYWSAYFPAYAKMVKMVTSPAFYEMTTQDLLHRDNWAIARQAGLENDPHTFEEFTNLSVQDLAERGLEKLSPTVADKFVKLMDSGNRGYQVLKVLRQDMFDKDWNQIPPELQTPEMAAGLADDINHITGVTKKRAGKIAQTAFFAPRLQMSRFAWTVGDTARAAKALLNWKNAPDAEKVFAVRKVRQTATIAGVYYGLLAINQGLLTATKSKQKINGIPTWAGGAGLNPIESDFLKFKAFGKDISYGGAMLNLIRLPIRLFQIRASNSGKLKHVIYPEESMGNTALQYARSQLHPATAVLADLLAKGDYQDRPLPKMPLSGAPTDMPKRLRAKGYKPYTWPEFFSEAILPIPLEEQAKDVWKNGFGMSDQQITVMLRDMAAAAVMGTTGSRITGDYTQPQAQK